MKLLILIIPVIGIIISFPFGFIWAVNTLFSLNIQYNFTNYIAALVLLMFTNSHSK